MEEGIKEKMKNVIEWVAFMLILFKFKVKQRAKK